ncbi:MAG: hypothetical protein JSW28_02200, partial [Thermoplasmata archaeon]
MAEADELLEQAEIKIDVLKKHDLSPSSALKRYIDKEGTEDKLVIRFRPIMIMEEALDSLGKGAFTKLKEIKCDNKVIVIDKKKGLDRDALFTLGDIAHKRKIKHIKMKVQHKRFSDITASAAINERKNREYRLHITFHGDLTKKELMKVNSSLETKFPGRGSGEYHKMKYSTGGFSKGDKA